MAITLTEAAQQEVKRILNSQQKPHWGLRVGVKDGGCSGMSYLMDIEEAPRANDHVFDCGGIKVFCDPKSYLFLNGLVIDFSNALLNGGFKFTNPNAMRTCSCGTSFSTGKGPAPAQSEQSSCCG
jgi:iron-sulfur cluster assembly accessory protein